MKKVLVISTDFSKKGGIEYLSLLVTDVLKEKFAVKRFSRKGKKIDYWIKKAVIIKEIASCDVVIFMHSFLHREFLPFIPKRVKSVVWAHGIEVWGNYGYKQNTGLDKASKVVAVSRFTERQIVKNWPGANVCIIPNCIPFDEGYNSRLGSDLIIVSRLSSQEKYKGHDVLLEALSEIKKMRPDNFPRLHVVGEGDDKQRLEQKATELNIAEQVVFHGYISDEEIKKLYSQCLVYVMPSYVRKHKEDIWGGEGFGLVYLEAGMNCLPVIGCNEGGQTDCIQDNVTGFLIPPNVEALKEKILYLIDNPDKAKEMGLRGNKLVKQKFTMDSFRKSVQNIICDL